MVEELKTVDTNTKTQLSLAAALFFSPLVSGMLKKNTRNITDKDRDFIRGYIKFGYISILFWIITIAAGVMNYLFALKILSVTYTASIFILLFLLVIAIVSILSDISLLKWWDHAIETYTIEWNKKDIIFKYLPIYNIYLRYKAHSFEKPNRRIKESIILRMLFMLVSMSGSVTASVIVLIVIILRIAALMSDIDFLNTKTKQQLNKLFFKNPEEIRAYITGFIVYAVKSLTHIFTKMQPYTLESEIAKRKEDYGHIIEIPGNASIITEYILWILLTAWLIYLAKLDFTVRTYYVWLWLFVLRYLVMAAQLKHLPHLPIAREIMLLVKGIWLLFKRKN